MLKSVEWFPQYNQASMLIGFADASALGMGIWFPGEYAGFQAPLPPDGPKDLIFYYEALAICSAIHLGIKYGTKQIAIYSDNTNSVDMFSSLCAKPGYNKILMSAIDAAFEHDIDFKVYYIPGVASLLITFLVSATLRLFALHQRWSSDLFNPLRMRWGHPKNDFCV
jgi:hypothetical protein